MGFLLLASLILPTLALRKRVAHSPRRAIIDRDALTEYPFLYLAAVMVLAFIGQYIPYFYLQVYSVEKDILTGSKAYLNKYLIVFLNCGSFVGRLVGYLRPSFLCGRKAFN